MHSRARRRSSRGSRASTFSSTADRKARKSCARPAPGPMMSSLPPPDSAARWYEDKVRTYGFDHRGLGFRSRSSQVKRFEALLELGDLDGRRVLDVGCGFGDFLGFLQGRGIEPVYTGIDVCEPMVRRCIERFGKLARFEVADVLEY